MTSTQNRIIEATFGLVADHGLSAVTMIDIARTAGIARATLYNHYPDVASILVEAATSHNDQAIAGLHQSLAVVASPTETIQQLIRYVATISSHGHTLQTHHRFPKDLRDQLSAFDNELERQIHKALAQGRPNGEFRPSLDIDTTTNLLRHMLNGVSELVAASPDSAAAVVSDATEAILAAIGMHAI